jgi:hypothetical protein
VEPMNRINPGPEDLRFICTELEHIRDNIGNEVEVHAYVERVRVMGGLAFILVKTPLGKFQVVVEGEGVKAIGSLKKGNYISVCGVAKLNEEAISGVEVQASQVRVLSHASMDIDEDRRVAEYLRFRAELIGVVESQLSELYPSTVPGPGSRLEQDVIMTYARSLLPSMGGVRVVSSDLSSLLACRLGVSTGWQVMSDLEALMSSLSDRESLDIPVVHHREVRRRVQEVFEYQAPRSGTVLTEEFSHYSALARRDHHSEWMFVVEPPKSLALQPSGTYNFILVSNGSVVATGYADTTEKTPPSGGFVLDLESLTRCMNGPEMDFESRLYSAAERVGPMDELDFELEAFLSTERSLDQRVIEGRKIMVKGKEDKQLDELLQRVEPVEGYKGELPDELVSILPIFSMDIEDVEFVFNLLPKQKPRILRMSPDEALQYLWSVLGHDQVKRIIKSSRMKLQVAELVEQKVLTDYVQLRYVHEAMLNHFGHIRSRYRESIDQDAIACRIISSLRAMRRAEVSNTEQVQVSEYIETGDEGALAGFPGLDARIIKRAVEKAKDRSENQYIKFARKLMASRPNSLATVMHMLYLITDDELLPSVDGSDKSVIWSAIDQHCGTPILFQVFLKLHEKPEKLAELFRRMKNKFSYIHKNTDVSSSKLTEDFYDILTGFSDVLGEEFLRDKKDVSAEIIYYFYRPINMDLATFSDHLTKVGGHTGDIEKLGIVRAGENWESELDCYSFDVSGPDSEQVLQAYVSKNNVSYLAKSTAGICTLNDVELFERPDHFHINLVDGATQVAVGNVQAYVLEDRGKQVLLIRALNPTESYLSKADVRLVVRAVAEVAISIAQSSEFDEVCLCESLGIWNADSSREDVRAVLDLVYDHAEEISLESPFKIYNYQGAPKEITTVFKIWGNNQ